MSAQGVPGESSSNFAAPENSSIPLLPAAISQLTTKVERSVGKSVHDGMIFHGLGIIIQFWYLSVVVKTKTSCS